MDALATPLTLSPPSLITTHLSNPILRSSFTQKKTQFTKPNINNNNFTAIHASVSSKSTSPPETEALDQDEKFDWFSQWYAVMPVCDLDKKAPVGKKVMGLDLVVWWDKNESAWKVFDDMCPHRLAPLSQGRIDNWGRLQCVYHGWCFNGSGQCKLIPQAPQDGPPVHSFQKACVAVYPSTVQNGIVWFWPNTDPQYKDILTKKKPPYIPELDDASFTYQVFHRDIPYGYEILTENLMDPAHVPYAHYGILRTPQPSVKVDREGGRPLDLIVQKIIKTGFTAIQPYGQSEFVAPCLYYGSITSNNAKGKLAQQSPKRMLLIFICVPVSPGHSRVMLISPRNFNVWMDRFVPRWIFHIVQNLVIDSDLYLLHVEEVVEDIFRRPNRLGKQI